MVHDFGRLDILVNNAGIRIHRPAMEVTEVTEEEWDAVVDTNLKGVFFCSQAAARHMIARGRGRIINIASQMAVVAIEDRPAYCASKAGVANLTRALALEWIELRHHGKRHRARADRGPRNDSHRPAYSPAGAAHIGCLHALGPPHGGRGAGGSSRLSGPAHRPGPPRDICSLLTAAGRRVSLHAVSRPHRRGGYAQNVVPIGPDYSTG